jgi:hypothetical protein
MATEQNKHQRYSVNAGDGGATVELEQLSRSYAAFRREHQPRMRIPEELREATLEAIGNGIPEKSVREACRISPEQLNRWREIQWLRSRGKDGRRAGKKAKARVFKVSDTPVEEKAVNGRKELPSEAVHLRIGDWEISLRQLER